LARRAIFMRRRNFLALLGAAAAGRGNRTTGPRVTPPSARLRHPADRPEPVVAKAAPAESECRSSRILAGVVAPALFISWPSLY